MVVGSEEHEVVVVLVAHNVSSRTARARFLDSGLQFCSDCDKGKSPQRVQHLFFGLPGGE